MSSKFNIPTILVVFGATGDLMQKKIIPSLYYLWSAGSLPKVFQIVAYSRRLWDDAEYREFAATALHKFYKGQIDPAVETEFLNLFVYQEGTFENLADYQRLGERLGNFDGQWRVCTNKLFYLSVPPRDYQQIFQNLKTSHLTDPCSEEEGWTRVLVEKPFGDDETTARALDNRLSELFKEEQIYRIDHYLAKEMLQNMLTFRFSNNLFEQMWSSQFIEKIEIRMYETNGVEDRGSFYDHVGALRDVGQNHLLQMLALITMDHPQVLDPTAIRQRRAEIIAQLQVPTAAEVLAGSFRAQYNGYQAIEGVAADSKTETYFKIRASLNSPRWAGVPISLESGKRLKDDLNEIIVSFKHPTPCLCPPELGHHYQNKIIFQMEPKEGIFVQFWAKKPGFALQMEERSFDFVLHQNQDRVQYVEEYAKLLLDAICGDQTLFVSTEEVRAMWRAIDPIVKAWQEEATPLHRYAPDSDAIVLEAQAALSAPNLAAKREVGIVGLGKMGGNAARRLLEKGWRVVGYNRSPDDTHTLEADGLLGAFSPSELVNQLTSSRLIWLMLPAGEAVDDFLAEVTPQLSPGDIVVDAGNSFYKDSIRRAAQLAEQKIRFVDVGFSGGPGGARHGACLMVGGVSLDDPIRLTLEPLLAALALPNGYQFFDGPGAGHFVKMIHNGIEYGMMQAIAEGFAVMQAADYALDLNRVTDIYNHGSVIESRLIGWLQSGFAAHGEDLADITSTVKHTGEGAWTVETAAELGVPVKIIEGALEFRKLSEQNPSYTGKILSTLREQFGGHAAK